ncbi:hypothetical protein D9757_007434 [Collybiopsis confluens]|uniref:Alpha/beta hydrolase fold-3 domain-containing protein n=1 Tax=Collybiopsis confluens TaxID=2823264 RepID=A0A8H5HIS0_9AGAR|nr:hypothetical protein D9757_007434 [Collybiopsis confluens]
MNTRIERIRDTQSHSSTMLTNGATQNNDKAKFGAMSWSSYVHMASVFIYMPFALALKALWSNSPAVPRAYAAKPLKRRIFDTIARYVFYSLSDSEIQWASGRGHIAYQLWTKRCKLEPVVDTLQSDSERGDSQNSHLLWIGPRRTDKVILYLPPGGFCLPVMDNAFQYWRYAQLEWKKQGLDVGIAILSYSVLPEAVFPTQLRQAIGAIEHLFRMGYDPSSIQLVGDSAGGSLLFQIFSHILHPLPPRDVPSLKLPPGKRFGGAYTMSPWVGLSDPEQWGGSFNAKAYLDVVPARIKAWGRSYLRYVPESQLCYADPILGPEAWYSELTDVVDRILISIGAEERLHDQVVVFFEKHIKPYHKAATLEVQEGGVHCDPLSEFVISNVPMDNPLMPKVLYWIWKGFQ